MNQDAFGIYILTYPGDFHLSTMLVRSIQRVSPDIPIMIIPGEGFDLDNHPFDIPVMPPPGGFWGEIGHQDRDFWAFQGPYEKFLYLDADTICIKSLDDLAERICRQDGNFIYIQTNTRQQNWRAVIEDTEHPDHDSYINFVRKELGTEHLQKFDPDHDFFAYCTFNSGVFASHRLAIKESDLKDLNGRERIFYRDILRIEEWNWKSSELFFRDQGRLNYLVRKLNIPAYPIEPELRCRGGGNAIKVSFEDVRQGVPEFHVIHYMGTKAPTPSLFSGKPFFKTYARLWANVAKKTGRHVSPMYEELEECPAFSLWRHYYENEFGPISLGTRLRWSWPDLRKTAKLLERSIRLWASGFRARS
jgi:hypothetical protein